MNRSLGALGALCALLTSMAGVGGQQAFYGPQRPLQDPLLDQLTGVWTVGGAVRGQPIDYVLNAEWVLNHQFLRLDMRDVNSPPTYEASVFIGYDNITKGYVAHWLDAWGGRFSETLGFGQKSGPAIRFTFDYPDAPCHTTFTLVEDKNWKIFMEDRDKTGVWRELAHYEIQRKTR